MDPELRGRVKRLAKAADRHDMIMLTADQRCLARDTADLLHAYDALRAENEKLRDAMRDMDAENRTLRTGNYASVYAEDLRKHAAERKRSAKLVEALKMAMPFLERAPKFYKYQRPGREFWPNREDAEAALSDARTALAAYRHSEEPAKEKGHD